MDLININTKKFTVRGDKDRFKLSNYRTQLKKPLCSKREYRTFKQAYREQIDDLQSMMYAHNRYGLLLIFQAMDAAGQMGFVHLSITTRQQPLRLKVKLSFYTVKARYIGVSMKI